MRLGKKGSVCPAAARGRGSPFSFLPARGEKRIVCCASLSLPSPRACVCVCVFRARLYLRSGYELAGDCARCAGFWDVCVLFFLGDH